MRERARIRMLSHRTDKSTPLPHLSMRLIPFLDARRRVVYPEHPIHFG